MPFFVFILNFQQINNFAHAQIISRWWRCVECCTVDDADGSLIAPAAVYTFRRLFISTRHANGFSDKNDDDNAYRSITTRRSRSSCRFRRQEVD